MGFFMRKTCFLCILTIKTVFYRKKFIVISIFSLHLKKLDSTINKSLFIWFIVEISRKFHHTILHLGFY